VHHRLFVYGTLMFPALMRAVIGRSPPARPAALPDYGRYPLRRRPYPAIVPARGERVDAWLVQDLSAALLRRLDDYEGPAFRRQRVCVSATDSGARMEAEAYVLRPRYRCLLLDRPWDPDAFARRWHDRLVRELAGFDHDR